MHESHQQESFSGTQPSKHSGAMRTTLLRPQDSSSGCFPAPGHSIGLTYNGGPIIKCPIIYTSFWQTEIDAFSGDIPPAARLNQFVQDLLKSNFMNVLHQYGVGYGAGKAGVFARDSYLTLPAPTEFPYSRTLSSLDIQQTVQSAIDAGVLPEPAQSKDGSQVVLLIYLSAHLLVSDDILGVSCGSGPAGFFGVHYCFTTTKGNNCYYAVIPYLGADCMGRSGCDQNPSCPIRPQQTIEQRLTMVTSHELAELTTDPEITPVLISPPGGPPQLNLVHTGWYSPTCGEIGDICEISFPDLTDTITLGGNSWTVQKIYSQSNDTSSSLGYGDICLGQAATPIPALPGPQAMSREGRRRVRAASYERLLPLPSVHFDVSTNRVSLEPEQVHRYIQRAFHPVSHENLLSDLPGFLHQIADILSQGDKGGLANLPEERNH